MRNRRRSRRSAPLAAAALVALTQGVRAEAMMPTRSPVRIEPRRPPDAEPPHGRGRPFLHPLARPRVGPFPPHPPPPPGESLPHPLGPSPAIEARPGPGPALAHGFHLTAFVGRGWSHPVPARLDRFPEVGEALAGCFAPPRGVAWGSITLRVSFRRDGRVFGVPRIPYIEAASPEQKAALARSLMASLEGCTPIPLSPTLGAAIAGEIFAVRFMHQDQR